MASIGKLESFDPSQETFECYVQRVKNFTATGIEAGKQKFVFLNSLGRRHYNLLANLVSPKQPEDKMFEELTGILQKHFQPQSSIISERYSFHCRGQDSNESITDFVVALKKLIIRCGYEAEVQKILLQDRFICGLAHESTRKRLLTENNDVTFERVVEIVTSIEQAAVQAKLMKSGEKNPIYNIKGKSPKQSPTCHRCRGPHLAPAWHFLHEKC